MQATLTTSKGQRCDFCSEEEQIKRQKVTKQQQMKQERLPRRVENDEEGNEEFWYAWCVTQGKHYLLYLKL